MWRNRASTDRSEVKKHYLKIPWRQQSTVTLRATVLGYDLFTVVAVEVVALPNSPESFLHKIKSRNVPCRVFRSIFFSLHVWIRIAVLCLHLISTLTSKQSRLLDEIWELDLQ